jgi:hypothetical protein
MPSAGHRCRNGSGVSRLGLGTGLCRRAGGLAVALVVLVQPSRHSASIGVRPSMCGSSGLSRSGSDCSSGRCSFTPDRPARGLAIAAAIREGTRGCAIHSCAERVAMCCSFCSRTCYADGLTTLFAFGGVYVSVLSDEPVGSSSSRGERGCRPRRLLFGWVDTGSVPLYGAGR